MLDINEHGVTNLLRNSAPLYERERGKSPITISILTLIWCYVRIPVACIHVPWIAAKANVYKRFMLQWFLPQQA